MSELSKFYINLCQKRKLFQNSCLALMVLLSLLLSVLAALQPVDSLVRVFENSRGNEKTYVANRIFEQLDKDEVTDSLMSFSGSVHPDTLALSVYYWAGESKMVENDFAAAEQYFTKAGALAEQGGNLAILSDCMAELAYCLTREGKMVMASEACEKAIDADTRLGDKDRLAISLNTMAYIYHMARRSEDAEKYLRRSLAIARELNDTSKIALRLGTLSDILMAQGRSEEALESAQEAFRLDSASANVPKMAIRKVQMAAALFPSARYEEAKALLLEALPVLQESGNLASMGIACNQLGDIYCKQEKWDDAARYFDTAVKIYSFTGEKLSESRAQYGMYQALRHSDPAEAALHLEKYAYLNDDIYNEELSRMTSEYNARYDNAALANENEKLAMRNTYLTTASALVLIIFLLIVAIIIQRARTRESEQEKRYNLLSERFSSLTREVEQQQKRLGYKELPLEAPQNEWLDGVDDYLRDMMREGNVSVDKLADRLCVSPRQLSRKFLSATGYNTQDYINRFRIDYACKMLSGGDRTVGEVARECGMDDIAYFSRFFKKMTGLSPTEFQKKTGDDKSATFLP